MLNRTFLGNHPVDILCLDRDLRLNSLRCQTSFDPVGHVRHVSAKANLQAHHGQHKERNVAESKFIVGKLLNSYANQSISNHEGDQHGT
jgi:hypothetical protein